MCPTGVRDKVRQGCVLINCCSVSHHHHRSCFSFFLFLRLRAGAHRAWNNPLLIHFTVFVSASLSPLHTLTSLLICSFIFFFLIYSISLCLPLPFALLHSLAFQYPVLICSPGVQWSIQQLTPQRWLRGLSAITPPCCWAISLHREPQQLPSLLCGEVERFLDPFQLSIPCTWTKWSQHEVPLLTSSFGLSSFLPSQSTSCETCV